MASSVSEDFVSEAARCLARFILILVAVTWLALGPGPGYWGIGGEVVSSQVTHITTGSDFLEIIRGSRRSRGSSGSGVKTCGSEPHPTRAGGQDDGSYTNSLKLYVIVK